MALAHKLSGALAGIPVANLSYALDAPMWATLSMIPISGLAALINDIDCEGSTATRSFGFLTAIVSFFVRLFCRGIYWLTRSWEDRRKRGPHRTFSHTLIGCICIGLLTHWGLGYIPGEVGEWSWLLGLAVGVGALAHVFGDMLTKSGCPLLWPFMIDGKRWHNLRSPLPFSTDSMVEHMFVVPTLRIAICVFGGLPLGLTITDPGWLFWFWVGVAWNVYVFLFGKRNVAVPVRVRTSRWTRWTRPRKAKRQARQRVGR